jgi:uncharacterized protein (TIGR03067 family)
VRSSPLVGLAVLLLCGGGLLVAEGEPKKDAVKEDMKKLQGTWMYVSAEKLGKPLTIDKEKRLVITGDHLRVQGSKMPREATFRLNPTTNPKHIDLTFKVKGREEAQHAIYEIKGETLKVCSAGPKGKRPPDFDSKYGVLLVLKRVKD